MNGGGLMIDQLLDSEIKNIENEVYEKTAPAVSSISNDITEKKEDKGKEEKEAKKTKAELVIDINALETSLNLPLSDGAKLKRKTKVELLKILAGYLDGSYVNTIKTQVLSNEVGEKEKEKKEPSPINISFSNESEKQKEDAETFDNITNSMLRMNLVACMLLETTSQTFKHKTHDIPLLAGYTDEINKQEQYLKPIFKQIYLKYRSQLDYVLSPIAQYSLVMSSTAVNIVNKNINEKKKESSEKSKIEVIN